MNNYLSIKYFDEKDNITTYLNCLQTSLYHAYITEGGEIRDLADLFLRDITFNVEEDNDGDLLDINFEDVSVSQTAYESFYIKGGAGVKGFQKVEELLDKGKPVLIQTFYYRLPFFKDFISFDYPFSEACNNPEFISNSHIFLAVGHDERNLYYTEAPMLIKKGGFVPHLKNSSVGVIEKKELLYAFNCYLNYTFINIKKESIIDPFKTVNSVLESTSKSYRKCSYIENCRKVHPGKEAIDWLGNYLKSKDLKMGNKSRKYCGQSNIDFFRWKIADIKRRRLLLNNGLKENAHQGDIHYNALQSMVAACGNAWYTLERGLDKRAALRNYNVDRQLIERFESTLRIETEMMDLICELTSK